MLHVLRPKRTTLAARLGINTNGDGAGADSAEGLGFVSFLLWMLQPNPDSRPSAAEAGNFPIS